MTCRTATTPSSQDIGFNIAATANGSTIKNLSAWGNYVNRVDGPGKFIDGTFLNDAGASFTLTRDAACNW